MEKIRIEINQKNLYKTHILEELLVNYSKLNEVVNILKGKEESTVNSGDVPFTLGDK